MYGQQCVRTRAAWSDEKNNVFDLIYFRESDSVSLIPQTHAQVFMSCMDLSALRIWWWKSPLRHFIFVSALRIWWWKSPLRTAVIAIVISLTNSCEGNELEGWKGGSTLIHWLKNIHVEKELDETRT